MRFQRLFRTAAAALTSPAAGQPRMTPMFVFMSGGLMRQGMTCSIAFLLNVVIIWGV